MDKDAIITVLISVIVISIAWIIKHYRNPSNTDMVRAYNYLKSARTKPSETNVICSASDFEKDLYKLINSYCDKGLKKSELVHKMKYVTKSCELS